MTDPERRRWEELQERFLDVLEVPAEARAAHLARLDPDARAEVTRLLSAHESAGPLPPLPAGARPPARQFGPFRLLDLLGTGGMGAVYLAERVGAEFEQRVALKLIRAGFADPRLEARIRSERQILARLEHPGIARLVDGGTTETGQSWFAMEYVEGTSLLAYCRAQKLPLRARLRLFLSICDALHHAHQQLVVHADLKPGNILITREGRAKLLDFGIGELLDEREDATFRTRTRTAPWLTPGYASPEQVRRQPVTTLTDVYSLGVILYELLADCRPYDVDRLAPAEIERIVCTVMPERPSQRAGDPAVRRALRGDLDTIILKALSKEPERRYASVEAFADDIRRHLDGRPVRARPDSFGYRAGKFVRRHRTPVGAAGLLLATLLGGFAAVSWQARRASEARDRAEAALTESEDLTRFLIALFEEANPGRAATDTSVSRALLRRGLARVEALASQPAVQARMLDALGQIHQNLGQYEQAEALLERGLALRRRHLEPAHADLAGSLRHLGRLLRLRGRYARAESLYVEALAVYRALPGEQRPAIAATLEDLAFLMPYLARNAESERYYRAALATFVAALGPHSADARRVELRIVATLRRLGRYEEAEAMARDLIARRRGALGNDHPDVALALVQLADILGEDLGRPAEAVQAYREAIAIESRTLPPDDPAILHPKGNLAWQLVRRGELAEAERLNRENLAFSLRLNGPDHPDVAGRLGGLADVLERQRRFPEAHRLRMDAFAVAERALGPDHPGLGGYLSGLADHYAARQEYAEAERWARRALELRLEPHGRDSEPPANSHVGQSIGPHQRRTKRAGHQRLHDRRRLGTERAHGHAR